MHLMVHALDQRERQHGFSSQHACFCVCVFCFVLFFPFFFEFDQCISNQHLSAFGFFFHFGDYGISNGIRQLLIILIFCFCFLLNVYLHTFVSKTM